MKRERRRTGTLSGSSLTLALAIVLGGEILSPAPRRQPQLDPDTQQAVAVLMAAPLDGPLGAIALHTWLVVREPGGEWQRWEVMPDDSGTELGRIHRDLTAPFAELGGGTPRVLETWRGPQAEALIARLPELAASYAHQDVYTAWPGPNSNTFVATMLRQAGVACDLPPTAIGKDYRGLAGAGLAPDGTLSLETPAVGVSFGPSTGLEARLGGLTAGVDLWPPALKVPFGDGRLGFSE